MTPLQAYTARDFAHNGCHLFQIWTEEAPSGSFELRLLNKWVKLHSIREAFVLWGEISHKNKRAPGTGFIRNKSGEITHNISYNGRVWAVKYLGRDNDAELSAVPATAELLGL